MNIAFRKHQVTKYTLSLMHALWGSHEDSLQWGGGCWNAVAYMELTNRYRGLVLTVAFGNKDLRCQLKVRLRTAAYDSEVPYTQRPLVCSSCRTTMHDFFAGCSLVQTETSPDCTLSITHINGWSRIIFKTDTSRPRP